MNAEELARVLRRDPNINVPRPIYKRPELTLPLRWKQASKHYRASRFPARPRTEPRQWLTENQLKTPWYELPPRQRLHEPIHRPPPPSPPPAPAKKKDDEEELLPLGEEREQGENPEAKKRDRSPDDDDDDSIPAKKQKTDAKNDGKIGKGRGKEKPQSLKATRPPAHPPGILPLSPQDAQAPRVANPEIRPLRNKFQGPGNFEHRWKNNPKADEDREIRDGIPKSFEELPEVRLMPERITKNKGRVKNFKYMGDQEFYDMDIPDSGDCFFGAVSMALYGTALYWHWVKYCHLYFFRFVLTHPGHPRYDSYWRLNSHISALTSKNIWQQLSIPHAWQSSDLLNVTADIFNLFIVLYEQLDIPKNIPKAQQKPQDHQSIGLFGQYNATHIFLHIINRNHYQTLIPYQNPEAQFPFPDGVIIDPRPGRAKERPPGGRGRAIIPPPIAQPVFLWPRDMDITRVLGINTMDGALNIDLVKTWIRRERETAEKRNDPTEVKWWIQAKEKEAKEEQEREAKALQGRPKGAQGKDAQLSTEGLAKNLEKTLGKWKGKGVRPSNEELAKDLEKTLGKGKAPRWAPETDDVEKKASGKAPVKEASVKGTKSKLIEIASSPEEANKSKKKQPQSSKARGKASTQAASPVRQGLPGAPATKNPVEQDAPEMIEIPSSPEKAKKKKRGDEKTSKPPVKTSNKTASSKSGPVKKGESPVIDLFSSSDEEDEKVKHEKTSAPVGKTPVRAAPGKAAPPARRGRGRPPRW
ncbi:hypothetical protein EAF04_009584 [Stromatinia cepivora]|nr:hypothetical protein EAF04_009584 [Stromatinia cepivora]